MKKYVLAMTVALASLGTGSVLAQTAPASSPNAGQAASMPAPFELPEACRTGGAMPVGGGGMMQGMQGGAGGMDAAHKGFMDAMMQMNPAMMQGMMAKDADVAFACSMVAHHMGALAMSRVELANGDDKDAKRIAEKTIKEQEAGIAELKEWIAKHAKK